MCYRHSRVACRRPRLKRHHLKSAPPSDLNCSRVTTAFSRVTTAFPRVTTALPTCALVPSQFFTIRKALIEMSDLFSGVKCGECSDGHDDSIVRIDALTFPPFDCVTLFTLMEKTKEQVRHAQRTHHPTASFCLRTSRRPSLAAASH